jgi:hypothetical protein
MLNHGYHRLAVTLVASLAVALIAAVALLAPVAADAPHGRTVGPLSDAALAPTGIYPISRTLPWPSLPISRGFPISRGIIVVPIPLWCNWPTPVPPPLPPGVATRVPPTPVPSPTPGGMASSVTYSICRNTASTVPLAVQQQALAEPWTIYGYNMRLNPNTPYHPLWNPLRTQLGLMNPNVAYHPCNPVVWKANCP